MGRVTASDPGDRQPWERQPGETSKAYEAFCVYRDMGLSRSVVKVGKDLGKAARTVEDWSRKYNWVQRTEAWDSIPAKAMAESYAEMVTDITDQHRALADKLIKRLSDNLDRMPPGMDPSVRWSQAHNAAAKSHGMTLDYRKPAPEDDKRDEVTRAIEVLIDKLAGD